VVAARVPGGHAADGDEGGVVVAASSGVSEQIAP
jgi:hypothetical protein